MDLPLPEESPEARVSRLNQELHRSRIDRYEIERSLGKIDSLKEDVISRTFHLRSRDRNYLIPLIQTIQDDLYRLHGSTWRSVYLANKRSRTDAEEIRLKRELYVVDKDSRNLLSHVNEARKLIVRLEPKDEATVMGVAFVLIAMSGFMFSSVQSFRMFAQPYTGFGTLPSTGLLVYFIFATLLVLAMFAFLFSFGRSHKKIH